MGLALDRSLSGEGRRCMGYIIVGNHTGGKCPAGLVPGRACRVVEENNEYEEYETRP